MTLRLFPALNLLIIVQISVVPYVNGVSCYYSTPTITTVKKCPMNEVEWEKEKERKQCHLIIQNCTHAEKFQYHCLPDKSLDTFIEVCAPILQTVGHYCPYYDTESKEIQLNYEQPCNEHSNPCPDFYLSNMVHKYKECYQKSKTKKKTKENDFSNLQFIETNGTSIRNGIFANCFLLAILVVLAILQIFCPQRCRKLHGRIRQRDNNRKKSESNGEDLSILNPKGKDILSKKPEEPYEEHAV